MKRLTNRGFTLIELLVVIGIIAILAAILFPLFASARDKARSVMCMSHMGQLGVATLMYTADYDERYPMTANYGVANRTIWTELLRPYFVSMEIIRCPSAIAPGYATDWTSRGYASIGMTALAAYDPNQTEGFISVLSVSEMDDLTRSPLFAETANARVGSPMGKYRGYTFDPCVSGDVVPAEEDSRLGAPLVSDQDLVATLTSRTAGQLKPIHARHSPDGRDNGRANVVLADGHAKSYSARQIKARSSGANLLWRFRACPF